MSITFPLTGRRVLVTGGAGFIGSHLVGALLTRGPAEVIALDSLAYGSVSNLQGILPESQIVRFRLGDDDPARLLSVLRGIDYVFHLAAVKHNQASGEDAAMLRSNIIGTQDLLQAAVQCHVRKVVFSSSLYACGRRYRPEMTEEETAQPSTFYGLTKRVGEELLAYHRRAFTSAPSSVALRYFFVYGPRQYASAGYRSVIPSNLDRLLRNEPPIIRGDGEQVLDYVYVEDVVEATIRAMEADVEGVINIGSGQPTSVRALIEQLTSVAGRRVEPQYVDPDWTAGTYRVAAIDRVRARLQWSPQVSLTEGLRRTLDWMTKAI